MNIPILDLSLSASVTLRKMLPIKIVEEKKHFFMRGQIHPLVVIPFGLGKSAIGTELKDKLKNDVMIVESFTKPSIDGSIQKDGQYVPSILKDLRGKILVVDEWNSVGYMGQTALLGVLQNQRISRTLGFKVNVPYSSGKNKWGYFKVKENRIEGVIYFSCIAMAMGYPIHKKAEESDDNTNVLKSKALLSRFSPIFVEGSPELCEAVTRGNFNVKLEDFSSALDGIKGNIVIDKQLWSRINTLYYEFVDKHNLWLRNTDDLGYITRILGEIARFGVYDYLKAGKTDNVIDNTRHFSRYFGHIRAMIHNFAHPSTKSKYDRFTSLVRQEPDMTNSYYAEVLGVSERLIQSYKAKDLGKNSLN